MSKKTRSETDRRVRQCERLARVLRVLQLIQSRGGPWNAQTIARQVDCSERTVFRDLQVLSFAGVPWYFDEATQSYRVTPGFRFPGLPYRPLSDDPQQELSEKDTDLNSLLAQALDASRQLAAQADRLNKLLRGITKTMRQTTRPGH